METFTIITENDISQWNDITGKIYHFPSKYRQLLTPGTKIIYYKGGIKDKSFSKTRMSDEPHYFGMGEIGKVWKDKENKKQYFGEIINYTCFNKAIPFKKSNGEYIEKIPQSKSSNYWRDGVREISKDIYDAIISLANLNNHDLKNHSSTPKLKLVPENILKAYNSGEKKVSDLNKSTNHYSKNSKEIGDKGEEYVYEYLQRTLSEEEVKTIKWHANIGETPGYDISYTNKENKLIAIEVKSTTGISFKNCIMTVNEINAAKQIKENYYIYLVADCMGSSPKLNIINNPTTDNRFKIEPLSFNLYLEE